jgi:hypothetical protein
MSAAYFLTQGMLSLPVTSRIQTADPATIKKLEKT